MVKIIGCWEETMLEDWLWFQLVSGSRKGLVWEVRGLRGLCVTVYQSQALPALLCSGPQLAAYKQTRTQQSRLVFVRQELQSALASSESLQSLALLRFMPLIFLKNLIIFSAHVVLFLLYMSMVTFLFCISIHARVWIRCVDFYWVLIVYNS